VQDLPLGPFDDTGTNGLTLVQARARAAELSRMMQEGIADPKAHLEAQARAKTEAEEATRHAEAERHRLTLAALVSAYADHLERQGKAKTAYDVRNVTRLHLEAAAPTLAALPAKDVTRDALAARIREIRESGKERTAGMFRSYLFAAYNLAARAEGDTQAPAALIRFGIETNPVAGIKAIPVRPGDRALSREELRTFIGHLGPSLADQALRLALYAGGQRGEQLLRARVSDFDPAQGILRLLDPKGRRQIAREHRLPLGPVAADLCRALVARAREEQPDSTDPPLFASGPVSLVATTLTHRVTAIAAAMGGARFTFRDLRRTVETEMASMGFSVDLRAQLLSHGLSGIQSKHYDRHGYMSEKAAALVAWERHLEGEASANVVTIGTRRAA
jgi:integrase